MNIKCNLIIKSKDIIISSSSINPDNNIASNDVIRPKIFSKLVNDYIEYDLVNFQNINTLRNTLDDLFSHLSFASSIKKEFQFLKKRD